MTVWGCESRSAAQNTGGRTGLRESRPALANSVGGGATGAVAVRTGAAVGSLEGVCAVPMGLGDAPWGSFEACLGGSAWGANAGVGSDVRNGVGCASMVGTRLGSDSIVGKGVGGGGGKSRSMGGVVGCAVGVVSAGTVGVCCADAGAAGRATTSSTSAAPKEPSCREDEIKGRESLVRRTVVPSWQVAPSYLGAEYRSRSGDRARHGGGICRVLLGGKYFLLITLG